MGKVLKVVAVIAIAAAIAYFAPSLTPTFLSTALGSAAATAVTATILSMAANVAMQALTVGPDAPSGYRRPTMQRDATGLRLIEVQPPPPAPEVLAPIEPRSWRHAFFWPWQTRSVIRISGDCMDGTMLETNRWAVIDRHAMIEPGAFFAFDLDDMWTAYFRTGRWRWIMRIFGVGMVKRYLGTEREWGRLVFDCTNPPSLCETGFNHVRYAYAVVGAYPSWFAARRACAARHHRAAPSSTSRNGYCHG